MNTNDKRIKELTLKNSLAGHVSGFVLVLDLVLLIELRAKQVRGTSSVRTSRIAEARTIRSETQVKANLIRK